MRYFYTADTHYGHANIIKYCGRPFKDVFEMDRVLIRNHNSRVKPEDTVIFNGDFCFKNSPGGKEGEGTQNKAEFYINQLNGRKIFLKGNHDKNNSLKTIIERLVIGYGGQRINIVHKPEMVDFDYAVNFTGHVHQNWIFKRIRNGCSLTDAINIGVDVNKFMPVTFEELWSKYSLWLKQEGFKKDCCTLNELQYLKEDK
jgi:calcineurin-like phosphoesterase family protein